MDAETYRHEFEAERQRRAGDIHEVELLIREFNGIIRRNVHDDSEKKKLRSLIKEIRLAAQWSDTYRAALFSYELGCQIARIVFRNREETSGIARLVAIREKSTARGLARKQQVMAETDEFAERVFPIAFDLASKNPKRGRLDIIAEVIRNIPGKKKRNARVIYEILKGRLPPREK